MAQRDKLRFHARDTALVQDFERLDLGIKKFLGWRIVQTAPPQDTTNPEDKGSWAFEKTGEAYEVPSRAEYIRACKDGDLWPADKATADACGVEFDPNFGAAKAPLQLPAKSAEKA